MALRTLVALAILAAPAGTVKLQQSGAAKVGAMAPSFGGWDLSGRNVLTLDSLRRTPSAAPLLVTFGASWCTACAKGLPRLKAIAARSGLRLVYIDVEMDEAKAVDFAARMGIDGPALLDKFGAIAKTYGLSDEGSQGEVTSLPRTFLLDEKGRVRAIYREEGADLEQVIEADLAAARATAKSAP
jgi:peroxiredoxin